MNLQPDPNEQSAALLRAILLTLNQSALPGETPAVPPVQGNPPSEIVTATCLMYASLLISLLAAFVAMLGKQWLNRYLRNSGGSMIERCGDRQRKCDGLEKWPLHFFVESLPVMLQAALLLLACGLCQHMWFINASVARTLISLTGLGVVFYVAIVISGTSSYACPFQTPASTALRGPWKKVRHGIFSFIIHHKQVLLRTRQMWNRVRSLLCRQSLPTTIPLGNIQVHQSEQWLKPNDLAIIRRTNADDVRCVPWILRNITDPEALDAAIRLAGMIRWFEDGINANPPYDLIVSTFGTCFDSTRTLYPGSRDRAYYSGRAMVWIHTLAECKSEQFASTFPLPDVEYTTPVPDPDLEHLLRISLHRSAPFRLKYLFHIDPENSLSYSQWISNLLLHYSWANRTKLNFKYILHSVPITHETKAAIPLNVTLNHLLVWCTFLRSPIGEEALKVQDKSYDISRFCSSSCSPHFTSDFMEPILYQLSKAVLSAINGTHVQRKLILHALRNLTKLETHPVCLTKIAYEWCSVVYENRRSLVGGWKKILRICLEIGFRHLDFRHRSIKATIAHTEHHRGLVDIVFESQESEVIADLLHAWTIESDHPELAHALLSSCAGHLVDLYNLVSFSPRLRRLVIRSVEFIGYEGFEGVGVERFIELLNHLHVKVDDMDEKYTWGKHLLDTIRSSEGGQHLSHWYWEFLVELAVPVSWWARLELDPTHSLQIVRSLTEMKEWSKLECWMGVVWMLLPQEADAMAEGDLGHSMLLLFRQRPGAVQKLEQWMGRWRAPRRMEIPESFQRICKQAHEAVQQDTL